MANGDTNQRIVRFSVGDGGGDGGGGALLLERPWRVTAGLKPDINYAVCNADEYRAIGGKLGVSGTVGFCFADPDVADVSLQKVRLLDAEPAQYGTTPGGGPAAAVKYRLVFADDRYRFVEPRGGRLNYGLLNPSLSNPVPPGQDNVQKVKKLSELIKFCLTAMGLTVTVPAVDDVDPPQDLKWFGTHAPTELARLLAMADCVFALQPDATYAIFKRGGGTDPQIPDGRALPAVTLDGADARGKTVVFTSFPTQVAVCLTQGDVTPGTWQFVARDANGAWRPIDDAGAYGSGTAIAEVNAHFPHTPDPAVREAAFRYVQLDPDVYDPVIAPLFRKAWASPPAAADDGGGDDDGGNAFEDGGDAGAPGGGGGGPDLPAAPWDQSRDPPSANGLPPQVDLDFRAKVAVQDPTSGQWSNSAGFVRLPVLGIYDGNVLKLAQRLVKLKDGASFTADLEGNCQPIDLDADVQVRFAVGSAVWDAAQDLFKPGYFYVGFSGSDDGSGGGGALEALDGQAAEQAMSDPDAIVVTRPELVAVQFGLGTDVYNAKALTDTCRALAGRYVRDASAPPRVLAAVGFVGFAFDGSLSEAELDQGAAMTRFRVDSWFRPSGSYLASEFERLRRQREGHPHQADTQGGRQAIGAAGSAAPVQPMNIAASASPTDVGHGLPYQVLMTAADGMTRIWDWPRVHDDGGSV